MPKGRRLLSDPCDVSPPHAVGVAAPDFFQQLSTMKAPDPLSSLPRTALVADSNSPEVQLRIQALAKQLALPVCAGGTHAKQSYEFLLIVGERKLKLQDTSSPESTSMTIDFSYGGRSHHRFHTGFSKQPLVRAVGPLSSHKTVLDATAGLGRDAFFLASIGYGVTAVERAPILAVMIEDALARAHAQADHRLAETLHRLTFVSGDARTVLASLADADRPDVVYLDPMYPPRRKSASPKKELRMCRALAGDDEDAASLFEQAMVSARCRVVVKRHPHAPKLAPNPSHQIRSKMLRFDVYVRTD